MCRAVCTAIIALSFSSLVSAEPVFLASYENEILRNTAGVTESFSVQDDVFGMHTDVATGEIFVFGRYSPMAGFGTVYRVENAETGPLSLVPYSTFPRHYGSVTKIDDLFHGMNNDGVWTLNLSDPDNPVETFVGAHGQINTGGAAYDPVGQILYMAEYASDHLHKIDVETGAATPIGPLGIDIISLGMEWWQGSLYMAAQNATSGRFEIGTVDVLTGAYDFDFELQRDAGYVATALAIIPEPAGLALAACLLAMSVRRR